MAGKISPSMMCADFRRLEDQVRELEQAGVEYLHWDIMDGRFVPNFTLGPDLMNCVRELTAIPFDLHLMMERPEDHLHLFDIRPGDIVSVHQESTTHLQRTLQAIRERGAKAAVALNPATPVYTVEHVLDDIDVLLIMTVNPGFAGQKLVPATLKKLSNVKTYLAAQGYPDIEIEVDGNVSWENAVRMREAGADIFVAGTSSIFRKGENIQELTKQFRDCIA
ncbi:ribulose-phosphate 3-epimerase [Paenibacillus swuensis]|uniref:Ribulose-phosphate 3-epimerase n=1 Tax=Paenibacillus swuensis TaxID=1178515 RepID=A0A172TME4_9BACL|nr:ribulose-phosphate 3-epimerase [Paenibacillus swuensis]ANE48239.1 ribulose-phosphate 3-epimerase [Paenibacillus swuensis]